MEYLGFYVQLRKSQTKYIINRLSSRSLRLLGPFSVVIEKKNCLFTGLGDESNVGPINTVLPKAYYNTRS